MPRLRQTEIIGLGRKRAELEEIATMAAEKTVMRFMLSMGVDATNPLEMQRDFTYLRTFRTGIETVRKHTLKTAVAAVTVGALGMIYAFFFHRT